METGLDQILRNMYPAHRQLPLGQSCHNQITLVIHGIKSKKINGRKNELVYVLKLTSGIILIDPSPEYSVLYYEMMKVKHHCV